MRKILLLTALAALPALAQSPRSVDVRGFDVAGVRLGMTPEAAKAAVQAQLDVDGAAIKDEQWPAPDPVTGEKVPAMFSVDSGAHKLKVYHAANVAGDAPQTRAVYLIVYELPYSADNAAAMAAAAQEKYGLHSNAPNDLPMQWCQTPNQNTGMGCDRLDEARLQLSQTTIRLEDPRYREALNQYRSARQSAAPKF